MSWVEIKRLQNDLLAEEKARAALVREMNAQHDKELKDLRAAQLTTFRWSPAKGARSSKDDHIELLRDCHTKSRKEVTALREQLAASQAEVLRLQTNPTASSAALTHDTTRQFEKLSLTETGLQTDNSRLKLELSATQKKIMQAAQNEKALRVDIARLGREIAEANEKIEGHLRNAPPSDWSTQITQLQSDLAQKRKDIQESAVRRLPSKNKFSA